MAGKHRKDTPHDRVCYRDHRPRLSTTCREALRQRRAWRALRAAMVDTAPTGLVDGLPEGRQGRVIQGSVHREGEEAQVSGTLCLSDFSPLPYAPARAKRAIIAARRGTGGPAPFPCPCGMSTLEAPCDQRRGSPQVLHSTALGCAGSFLPEPHPSVLSGSWAHGSLSSLSGQARSGAVRAEAIPWGRPLLPQAVATPAQQRVFFQDEGVEGAWPERRAHRRRYNSILKFFHVDITGVVRMTSCARYFKEGVDSSRPH